MTDNGVGHNAYGEIYTAVERHRAALLRMERAAASEMVRAYGLVWRRMQARITKLVKQYQAASTANAPISPAWVHEYNRLNDLMAQVEGELRKVHGAAYRRTVRNERVAIEASMRDMRELISIVGDPGISAQFNRVPISAMRDMVGTLRNGTPLRTLLDVLGVEASSKIRDELLVGLAMGEGPRAVARRIRGALGGDLARALRISRTETLRAYRTATNEQYKANEQIINGWRWVAAKSGRTCAACLALDGTWHPSSEVQADHPNGRCSSVPCLRGRDDSTQPATWETGSEWLAKQTPEVQQQVLGKGTYEAYKNGAVSLDDLRGDAYSPVWGHTPRVRPLAQVVGPDEAVRWAQATTQSASAPTAREATATGQDLRPYRLSDVDHDRLRQETLDELEFWWAQSGMDPDTTREDFARLVEDAHLGERNIQVRAPYTRAASIVQEGRFKSQFETGSSRGTYSPPIRAQAEYNGLGYPLSVPAEERPIYGYIPLDDLGLVDDATQYGEIAFIMRREVHARSTVTLGDSLGSFARASRAGVPAGEAAASPECWPDPGAIADMVLPGPYQGWESNIRYIEAQIQGPVMLADVERVIVQLPGRWVPGRPITNPAERLVDTMVRDLISRGIAVTYR